MDELINSNSESVGVYIHDLSIRFNEQVIMLDVLDPTEVLAEPKLQLSGCIMGKVDGSVRIRIEQSYRPFSAIKKDLYTEQLNMGKFRSELRLHNGINKFNVSAVTPAGDVIASKDFSLSYKGSFREWNETIFIAFFLAILIRGLVIQAFWIPTGSMEPTLLGEAKLPDGTVTRSGDRILVNRFAYVFDFSLDGRLPFGGWARYWLKLPERGDIVVFRFPDPDPNAAPKDYIKRVIGLPGDRIKIVDGITYVNDVPLNEPYIKAQPVNDYSVTVEEGSLFVMGDNRNNSYDSRYWGLMPLTNLKGQAVFVYLPMNRIGPIKSFSHENVKLASSVGQSQN